MGGPFLPSSAAFLLTNSGSSSFSWSPPQDARLARRFSHPGDTGAGRHHKRDAEFGYTRRRQPERWGLRGWTVALLATLNSQLAQEAPFTLLAGQSVVQNGGFETGQFTGWTLVGDTTDGTNIYNAVGNSNDFPASVHSGNYGAFLGDTKVATLSQTLATVPGEVYLLSFWLDNPTNGSPEEFFVNWLVKGAPTRTLYRVTSPPVLPWTNLQYLLTATSTNPVLQFAAVNTPFGFGLDDVSVTPIPGLQLQLVANTNGAWNLTWLTAPGVTYQVQYEDDLLQANWTALETPILATTSSLTVTDPGSGTNSAQRFYRLVASP